MFPSYMKDHYYVGIREDPLGKTTEKYHLRQGDYDRQRPTSKDTWSILTYYRVRDLVVVYEKLEYDNDYIEWTEYLNGGMTEYQGTFTKSDFHVAGCIYTAANFLE